MNTPEIVRKILHIVFGILILVLAILFEKGVFIRILFILLLLCILLTLLHLRYNLKPIAWISKEEEKRFPLKGLLFFIAGAGIAILIFNRDIALASITILTFGDSVCSLANQFGVRYKINPFKKFKSLFGTGCGIVIAFLFALIFIDPLSALVGSFFGMIVEAVSIKLGESDADDNIIIPLAAGTAMYMLSRLPTLASII
jgi:dolichol kinase